MSTAPPDIARDFPPLPHVDIGISFTLDVDLGPLEAAITNPPIASGRDFLLRERLAVVPLYFAAERPTVIRNGQILMRDDDRMPLAPGEAVVQRRIRFRTLGCYPLTAAVESDATDLENVVAETLAARSSERQGRLIDHDQTGAMEKKKQEGYF